MGNRTPSSCDACNQPADETMVRLPCNHYIHLRCSDTYCKACVQNSAMMHVALFIGIFMLLGALIGYTVGQKPSGCAETEPLVGRLKENALRLEKATQAACWRKERKTTIAEALERAIQVLREETDRIENQAAALARSRRKWPSLATP